MGTGKGKAGGRGGTVMVETLVSSSRRAWPKSQIFRSQLLRAVGAGVTRGWLGARKARSGGKGGGRGAKGVLRNGWVGGVGCLFTSRFPGFRSRCRTRAECRYFRPRRICRGQGGFDGSVIHGNSKWCGRTARVRMCQQTAAMQRLTW